MTNYPNKELRNRKAKFNYTIIDTFDAGIVLTGTEVKSLRMGQASISEAYAVERDDEIFLLQANISPYPFATAKMNHLPTRERKLLLKKKEITKIKGSLTRERTTLVPLSIYFNERGLAKCTLGLGKGKTQVDKRQTIKERDWQRQAKEY